MATRSAVLCLCIFCSTWFSAATNKGVNADEAACCCVAPEGDACYEQVMWHMTHGIHDKGRVYPTVTIDSSFVDFQAELYRMKIGGCYHPCVATTTTTTSTTTTTDAYSDCIYVAVKGDECYADVQWAMQQGIYLHPEAYPNLDAKSSFGDFQALLSKRQNSNCPYPCETTTTTTTTVTTTTTTTPCAFMATPGDACYEAIQWALHTGIYLDSAWFPGVTANSSLEEVQLLLSQREDPACVHPCHSTTTTTSVTTTTSQYCCCVATSETPCFHEVTWAREQGIFANPDWYPGLHRWSTFIEFQQSLFESGDSTCPAPCSHDGMAPVSSSVPFASPFLVALIFISRIVS